MLIYQEEAYLIPLEDIAVVVIEAREVTITAPLLSALAQYGVTLLTCDDTFIPCGQWLPFSQYYRYLKILRQQLAVTEPKRKRLWQQIIIQKVRNQAWVAQQCGHMGTAKKLSMLSRQVKSGDTSYIESQAASLYFQSLFGTDFCRQRDSVINSCLNYGYAILRSAITRALVLHGFLPVFGLQHRSELNAFNLVDDFIEPYRPLVDFWVLSEQRQGQLKFDVRAKQSLISLLHYQIQLETQKLSVLTAINRTVESFQSVLLEKATQVKLPYLLPLREHHYE